MRLFHQTPAFFHLLFHLLALGLAGEFSVKLGDEYMESFCSAGRRESSTWALLVRPIELIGHRFRGSDWASTTWALRHRGMLRVCARAAASDEMSGHIVSERDNIPGGNLLAWQCEP